MRLEDQKGDLPYCIDCEHYIIGQCTHIACSKVDLVKGRQAIPAADARGYLTATGGCGAAGTLYKKRRIDFLTYALTQHPLGKTLSLILTGALIYFVFFRPWMH